MFSRFGQEATSTPGRKVTRRRSMLGALPSAGPAVSSTVASIISPMKNRKKFWPKRGTSIFGNKETAQEDDSPLKTSPWSPVKKARSIMSLKDSTPQTAPIESLERTQQRRVMRRRSSLTHVPQRVSATHPTSPQNPKAYPPGGRKIHRTASGGIISPRTRQKPLTRGGSSRSMNIIGRSPVRSPIRTNSARSISQLGKSPVRTPVRTNSGRSMAQRAQPSRTNSGRSISTRGKSPVRTQNPNAVSTPVRRATARNISTPTPQSPVRMSPPRILSSPNLTGGGKKAAPVEGVNPLPRRNLPAEKQFANTGGSLSARSLMLQQKKPKPQGQSSQSLAPKSPMRSRAMSPKPMKTRQPAVPKSPKPQNRQAGPPRSPKPQKASTTPKPQTPMRRMKPLPPQESPDTTPVKAGKPPIPNLSPSEATNPKPSVQYSPKPQKQQQQQEHSKRAPGFGFRRATLTHVSPQVAAENCGRGSVQPPPLATAENTEPKPQQRPVRSPAKARRATMQHVSPHMAEVPASPAGRPRALTNTQGPPLSPATSVPATTVGNNSTLEKPQGRAGFRRATMQHVSPQVVPPQVASPHDAAPESEISSPCGPPSDEVTSTELPAANNNNNNSPRVQAAAARRPPGVSRRTTLSHVPFMDENLTQPNRMIQGPAATQSIISSPESPAWGRKKPFQYPNARGWPQTPAVHHSPMKRPGKRKVVIAKSDGLYLQTEDEARQAAASRNTRLYEYARQCDWENVAEECRLFPRDAKCVDEIDGTTALHLAVMSRSNPSLRDGEIADLTPAPIQLIEQLVVACPEAAITRCLLKKYTPLTYACLVLDGAYDMEDSAKIVSILLHHAPQSVYVFTDDGFSGLDIHILAYSRYRKSMEDSEADKETSTVVLQTLLKEKPDLAEARSYKNRVRGPVELLYRSNLEEFKDIGNDPSVAQSDWWAWKWVSLLLKYVPNPNGEPIKADAPFSALHAAAGLVGCPLPVLSIAASAYPSQLAEPDPRGTLGNLPLHEVCSWVCDQETINGDPFVLRRKSMAIECLLHLHPDGAKVKNKMKETPLQLAVESCTPWDVGLKALVDCHHEALAVPRKLRDCDDDNDNLISVDVYEDHESVGSDWVDPLEAVEGMFPFMVAAIVSHVPEIKRKGPSHFSGQTAEEHEHDLRKKELESTRSIYGLLRADPGLLSKYKPVFKVRREENDFSQTDYSDYSDYTEVTFDD